MSEPTFPRAFVVQRDTDVSGVSGEGIVAEGVQFSDGWVVTHWLDRPPMHEPKTDVWHNPGIKPFERVHGHGGATRVLWADEHAEQRAQMATLIADAFDVPAQILGTEAERAVLYRDITSALGDVWRTGRARYLTQTDCGKYADAVMPVVEQLLEQRNHAQRTVSAAYRLADNWRAAHGSSTLLVRAAGAELRDELDDSKAATGDVGHPEPNGEVSAPSGADDLAAVECSALYTRYSGDWRQCIRAAQHRGDHIDDRGFHWSDTVAVYPVADGPTDPVHILAIGAPDGETRRQARRTSLRVLINRVNRGFVLTPDEAQLLARHVATEICDANAGRTQAEQAEDLLRVAHDTSNRSEAERGRAVQRAEQAKAAIDRVRAVGPWLEYEATAPGMAEAAREVLRDASRRIRAALDGAEQAKER